MVPWKGDESAVFKGPYDKIKISRQILNVRLFIGFLVKISNSKISFYFLCFLSFWSTEKWKMILVFDRG